MRLVLGVLACLGAGTMTVALADPTSPAPAPVAAPSTPPASAPSASASAPAAAPAPSAQAPAAAAPVKPAVDAEEKRLIAQGYKLRMRGGEKVFCRVDPEIGTRLGGRERCGTVRELNAVQTLTREAVEQGQRNQLNPSGR